MIPAEIASIPAHQKRLTAVRAFLSKRAAAGQPIWITEMLMEGQPNSTLINMAIDGHKLNGASPVVDRDLEIDMPRVRLMTVEEGQTIKVKRRITRRVPGTDIEVDEPATEDLGNDVTLPHHLARDVMWRYGFPTVDRRTRGNHKGHIVEVGWLEAEVKRQDCLPELRDLWERMQPRLKKAETTSTKGKAQ